MMPPEVVATVPDYERLGLITALVVALVAVVNVLIFVAVAVYRGKLVPVSVFDDVKKDRDETRRVNATLVENGKQMADVLHRLTSGWRPRN